MHLHLSNSQVAVKVAGRHGNIHKSCLGVKQGCPLSPTLFGLYMDGLLEYLQSVEGGSGPQLSGQRVSALMYADDIVLMSTTAEGLQRLINAMAQYCRGKGMTVMISPAKTAVVVFRSKSHKAAWEHTWTCDAPLQQCDAWKYHGLGFTAKRGVAGGMLEMQRRQNAAAGLLRWRFKRLDCHYSVDVMMQLYLMTVAPTWAPCTAVKFGVCGKWWRSVEPGKTNWRPATYRQ